MPGLSEKDGSRCWIARPTTCTTSDASTSCSPTTTAVSPPPAAIPGRVWPCATRRSGSAFRPSRAGPGGLACLPGGGQPGSEDWLNATEGLAEQLRKAGQHRAALELLDEYLKVNKVERRVLLDAAESHIALGEKEQARVR